MTTSDATSEAIPAWAKTLNDNVEHLITRISDLETQLRDINAQLQTIGNVDQFGHPL